MLARRLLFLVAVLLGLSMVAAAVAPQPEPKRPPEPRGLPSASAGTTAPRQINRTITADPAHPAVRVRARVGDLVNLRVRSSQLDTVAVGDLQVQAVDVNSDAVFDLLADTPGNYPIVLLQAGRRIGTLEVSRPSA